MKQNTSVDSWVVRPKPNPLARMRLLCLPYGGGGASIFRDWPQRLPDFVEVCAIQLPGRENRLREPSFTDVPGVVQALTQVLPPFLNIPFAFFGHSLGALIVFELARQLRRENGNEPIHLFISGQCAPQIPDTGQVSFSTAR